MAVEAFAPAKINLALHVTGRRPDGYHLLDSLVAFADVGDHLVVRAADTLSLTITGPQAAHLPVAADNLVLRAARLLAEGRGAAISLDKVLPVASGIGGGSADAAAALRALATLWNLPLPSAVDTLSLGADVPVCLLGKPVRMRGVGEALAPVRLPAAWLVLANPGAALPTAAVFAALASHDHPPMPHELPHLAQLDDLVAFLQGTRNDLEPPAMRLAPAIALCKAALAAQAGCRVARMSGSGATCFGLFADRPTATAAARSIEVAHPGWWVAAAALVA